MAQGFTVKVLVGDTNGSGVIIGRSGNTYRVVTNAHVVTRSSSYKIQAPDGKIYTGKLLEKGSSLQGNDLAILTFESTVNYGVATLADGGTLQPNDAVYSTGFPIEQNNFVMTSGTVKEVTSQPLKGGYQLGYSADTLQGMSGGALLNSAGQLIGIVGMGKGAALTEAYTYQDESRPARDVIEQWRGMSFAVPVATINQITGNMAQVPSGESQAIAKAKNYTGIVKKVDDIAQQVTVRIDGGDGSNGSGVIIGKNNNRYYILTNKHVVYNKTLNRLIATKVITPDGKEQAINPVNIELMKGDLDLAVVSFDSVNNYQVATLGKYPINFNQKNIIFTHGFSSNKPKTYTRQFTAGQLMPLAFSSWVTKDEFSLKNGYQMVYTNFSSFGMSGGPILDKDGQVIGINGAAENELMTNSQGEAIEVPLGFSLGITITTFLSAVKQTSMQPNLLNISAKIPPDISDKERESMLGQVSALEMPSASANVAEWLQYGSLLSRVARYQEAKKAFEQVLRLNPKSSQAYYLRSLSYSETENKEKENEAAIADLYQAIQLDPGFEMAWRFLGFSLGGSEKYEEALKVSDEMIRRFPKSANSYFFKFLVLRGLDKKQEALDSLNKAIELEPSFVNYIMRVMTYMPNDYQKAIADLDKVLELNPNYLTAYYLKAVLFQQKGDIQNALKEMNQLRKQTDDPNLIAGSYLTEFLWKYQSLSTENKRLQFLTETDKILNFNINNENLLASIYWFRSSQYFENNDLPKALLEIDKSLRYKIDDPYLLRVIRFTKVTYLYNANTKGDSIVQERIKLLSNSIEDFKALPSVEKEENELTQILSSLDFPDRVFIRASVAEFKNIIGNDPNTLISGLYRLRGDLYKEQKNFYLALSDYNTAIELAPKNAVFYNVRGNFYYSQKKLDLALADFNKAIQIDPKQSDSYYSRANIYYSQDKFDLALADLSKVIELAPKNAISYNVRGNFYYKQKKLNLALADFNKAIQIDPKNAIFYGDRAFIYYTQDKFDLALADLSKAIELDPKYISAYLGRGVFYQKQKKFDLALADYNQAILLDPQFAMAYANRGVLYKEMNNTQQAIKDLKTAAQLFQSQGNMANYQKVLEKLKQLGQ